MQPKFMRPCMGRISSGYGRRKHPITGVISGHHGVDIAPRDKTQAVQIKATADGVVRKRYPDKTFGTYGNCLILTHTIDGRKYESLYAHLHSFEVTQGQRVKQGQVIAWMGNTGGSTGRHLHFEIHKPAWNNQYTGEQNPLNYITQADTPQYGYEGTDIKGIQGSLKTLGFYGGEIDGSWGPALENAVRAFQKAHKLTVDGLFGPGSETAAEVALKGIVQASKPKAPEVAEVTQPKEREVLETHREAWEEAKADGIMNGQNPGGNLSREQYATVRKREKAYTEQMVRRLIQEIVFGADREVSAAHREGWEKATAAGLVNGERPGAAVPREQLTSILDRAGVIPGKEDKE